MLKEQGDLSVGGSIRLTTPQEGAHAFLAAAPTDSTRLYVAGSFSDEWGKKYEDRHFRRMTSRNTTKQLEFGGGWGYTRRRFQLEALAGVGLGRTNAKQCDWTHPWFTEHPESCFLWVDSQSWFVKPLVQLSTGGYYGPAKAAGGIRFAVVRYQLERLFDAPNDRVL